MSEAKSAKILVTVPADLHKRIQDKANEMRRSLSGYIGYVMDRELPPPTSVGSTLDKAIAKKHEELKALVEDYNGAEVVCFKDRDGVLQPVRVNAAGYPTTKELAVSIVLQDAGVAMANRVPSFIGEVHAAKYKTMVETLRSQDK
jgi:hypothetical protein